MVDDHFRDLVPFENFYLWRNKLEIYSNFRVAVEYSEDLSIESIFYALIQLVKKFNQLSINVSDSTGNKGKYYEFGFITEYRLNDVLDIVEDEYRTVEELFNEIDGKHFDYGNDKPLWSLVLFNKKTLIFYCDHLLYDGTSGINFHREFLKALKNPIKLLEYQGINSQLFRFGEFKSDFQITPKPTDIADYSVPFKTTTYVILTELMPDSVSRLTRYYFSGNKYSNLLSYKQLETPGKSTKDVTETVHLSSEQVSKLLNICRSHNVKLTALLTLVSQLAIQPIVGPDNDVSIDIPTNARSMLNINHAKKLCSSFKPELGPYFGLIQMTFPSLEKLELYNKRISWEIVQYINKRIQEDVNKSLYILGLLKFIRPQEFLTKRKSDAEKVNLPTLSISNLGNLKNSGNGDIGVVNAWFDQPTVNSLFSINIITSPKGINLGLRSLSNEWLMVFKEGMDKWLSTALND